MGSVVIDEVAQTCSFVDVTVTFPYGGSVSESKVGTITITGAQGVSNILMGLEGAGGPPSPPRNVTVTYIEHNETPSEPVVTVVDPGGPGEAAVWDLALELPKGPPGDTTAFEFLDADDLTGTATNGYTITYTPDTGDGDPGVVWTPIPRGDVLWPTSINTTALSNTSPRLLATVSATEGRFPYRWRPIVHGFCLVTGAADVRVDLIAYLGSPDAGGKEIGRARGIACGAAGMDRVWLIPRYPINATDSDGRVEAGAAASIYLRAVNQGNASANWSTNDTTTDFFVEVVPVP